MHEKRVIAYYTQSVNNQSIALSVLILILVDLQPKNTIFLVVFQGRTFEKPL
jgi:hypothetical protein